jgi:hypothetical protein
MHALKTKEAQKARKAQAIEANIAKKEARRAELGLSGGGKGSSGRYYGRGGKGKGGGRGGAGASGGKGGGRGGSNQAPQVMLNAREKHFDGRGDSRGDTDYQHDFGVYSGDEY